jgi:predicted O-methyltransferase YrrM
MKKILIKDYLKNINVDIKDVCLGDFDAIGEYTAKKNRSRDSDLYASAGCFFRPNYERGILIYELIKKHNIKSMLEIGFGRGYGTFCAAKAMCDLGIEGKITTVDPNLNEEFLKQMYKIFPNQWFEKIQFLKQTSDHYFSENKENFDFIYIDGDHRYEAVKKDWENSKNKFNKLLLFDDYHLPEKKQKDIDCAKVIDTIEEYKKTLIIMDRRIFFDDRGYSDDEINYGQVLILKGEKNDI